MSSQECVKCGRLRSEQFMQEAVFRNFVGDEGAGVWKCASTQSCRAYRKKQARDHRELLENLEPDSDWRYKNWDYPD